MQLATAFVMQPGLLPTRLPRNPMNTMVLTRPATLSDDWGRYRTPEGEMAYVALASGGERP
jgi:hypothetical protein